MFLIPDVLIDGLAVGPRAHLHLPHVRAVNVVELALDEDLLVVAEADDGVRDGHGQLGIAVPRVVLRGQVRLHEVPVVAVVVDPGREHEVEVAPVVAGGGGVESALFPDRFVGVG